MDIAVRSYIHHYGNSHAMWVQTVLPATRQWWHSCFYPSKAGTQFSDPGDAILSWPNWLLTWCMHVCAYVGRQRHIHCVTVCLFVYRYLYINSRAWPKDCKISEPLNPPPIAENISIHVLDLETMTEFGPVFHSHKAFTSNDECFFIFLDVSDRYVARWVG